MSLLNINVNESRDMKDHLGKSLYEKMKGGPSKTKITIIDHNTGKILQEGSNKILIPGGQITACREFGLAQLIAFPTYNGAIGLDTGVLDSTTSAMTHSTPSTDWATQPKNTPIVCLWGAGRSGYGVSANEVIAVKNTDRIAPPITSGSTTTYDLIPFRYVSSANDIDTDLRNVYFGRMTNNSNSMISYYFKAFDTSPQLHIRYLDGTEVTSDMYTTSTDQIAEVYVEMKLSVSKKDFREFFDQVLGWDNANISTISLLTAWYDNSICENSSAEDADKIYYKWYKDIIPFSKWNFKSEDLSDLTRAIDFNYQVYY